MANSISYARAFFKILTQPKETLRFLVDNDPGYGRWVLIPVYTFLAGLNPDLFMFCRGYLPSSAALLADVVLMMAFGMVFYWLGAIATYLVGKWLGGTGSLKDVSTAYAWAYVPCFAAVLIMRASEFPKWALVLGGETDLATVLAAGRWWRLIAFLPSGAFFLWSWVLIAFGVSEAHRISLGRGFGVIGIFFGALLLVGVVLGVLLVVFILGSMRF